MDAKTMTMPNGDIINLMDEEARNILGDETLDTTAQTCTGAINELKGTLIDLTYKSETVTTVNNPNVSPFSCFGEVNIATDVDNYGTLISAFIKQPASTHIALCNYFYNNANDIRIRVVSNVESTFDIVMLFSKKATQA